MAWPMEGKIAVRPVMLIIRPVNMAPSAMPAVSGSISSPTRPGSMPRTACR